MTERTTIPTWLAHDLLHVYAEHQRQQPEPFRTRAALALTASAERLPEPSDTPDIERRTLRREITDCTREVLDLDADGSVYAAQVNRTVDRFRTGITSRLNPYLRFGTYRGYEVDRGSAGQILAQWLVSHGDLTISVVALRRLIETSTRSRFELALIEEKQFRTHQDFRIIDPPKIREFGNGKYDVTYPLEYSEVSHVIDSIINH